MRVVSLHTPHLFAAATLCCMTEGGGEGGGGGQLEYSRRTVGVVDWTCLLVVSFATVKGAYDMSLKISSLFAFVVSHRSLRAGAEPCTRICFP